MNNQQISWLDFDHKIILNNGDHVIVKTTIEKFYKKLVQNWKFNRPVDLIRIPEIIQTYQNAQILDGIIYLYKTNCCYICYDGIHRIHALTNINPECIILLDILNNPPEHLVKERFMRINKTIPVPLLYSNPEFELNTRKTIETIVKMFNKQYKPFFSTSRMPRVPHENRDAMMDKLQEYIDEHYDAKFWSISEWVIFLTQRNQFIKNNLETFKIKLNQKQLEKCQKYDFYLFCKKNWHLIK